MTFLYILLPYIITVTEEVDVKKRFFGIITAIFTIAEFSLCFAYGMQLDFEKFPPGTPFNDPAAFILMLLMGIVVTMIIIVITQTDIELKHIGMLRTTFNISSILIGFGIMGIICGFAYSLITTWDVYTVIAALVGFIIGIVIILTE